MLLCKFANKIINKQPKTQREDMTDILIYKDIDRRYQNIRMTYSRNRTRFIAHNVINDNDEYNKKINLIATKVPIGLNIDHWEPIHSGAGTPYKYTYRIEDGDREAVYNFKGLPTALAGESSDIIQIMINNSKTGVWLTIECKNNRPKFIFFNFEKIKIEVAE